MKWFSPDEFQRVDLLRPEMQFALDQIREQFGYPLIVTSSYRSPAHNARIGGAPNSSHVPQADGLYSGIDFTVLDNVISSRNLYRLVKACYAAGIKRIGLYSNMRHIHIDMEEGHDQEVMWVK